MQSRVLKLIHMKSFIRHVQLVIFLSVQFQDSLLKGIKKALAYKIFSTQNILNNIFSKVLVINQIINSTMLGYVIGFL